MPTEFPVFLYFSSNVQNLMKFVWCVNTKLNDKSSISIDPEITCLICLMLPNGRWTNKTKNILYITFGNI